MLAPHERSPAMKAVILAGGEGTRLRPLTLSTPKPVVPVVDRPFLRHQLDLLASAHVSEIVLSLAYRPERIKAVFGDGAALGRKIHYAVEDTPLGTGGAIKNAAAFLDDLTVVFNGDVLTDVDLPGVIAGHRARGARATLVLTPVANPAAYGLVETDPDGRVRRFVEKPEPSQVTTDTVNAGIYVLDTATLASIPPATRHSVEREFFPQLLARGEAVFAHVHRGYWIDIGTPAKYLEVHRDVLDRRFPVALEAAPRAGGWIHACAQVAPEAILEPPFYVGRGCRVAPGARVGPHAVLVEDVTIEAEATVSDSVVWAGSRLEPHATVSGALLGLRVRAGRHSRVGPGAVLGEGSVLADFTRTA
jgi:NDP-sugar pyrophosphorylase family protein